MVCVPFHGLARTPTASCEARTAAHSLKTQPRPGSDLRGLAQSARLCWYSGLALRDLPESPFHERRTALCSPGWRVLAVNSDFITKLCVSCGPEPLTSTGVQFSERGAGPHGEGAVQTLQSKSSWGVAPGELPSIPCPSLPARCQILSFVPWTAQETRTFWWYLGEGICDKTAKVKILLQGTLHSAHHGSIAGAATKAWAPAPRLSRPGSPGNAVSHPLLNHPSKKHLFHLVLQVMRVGVGPH